MTRPPSIKCVWYATDEYLKPVGTSIRYCLEQFGNGEVVTLERNEERSQSSHSHYFAALNEAWQQLPEDLMHEYPSVEILRARALIKTGHCTMKDVLCDGSFSEFVQSYSIIEYRDGVLRIFNPKSQSRRKMKKEEFQKSKDDVLGFVANLVGVSVEQLKANA